MSIVVCNKGRKTDYAKWLMELHENLMMRVVQNDGLEDKDRKVGNMAMKIIGLVV